MRCLHGAGPVVVCARVSATRTNTWSAGPRLVAVVAGLAPSSCRHRGDTVVVSLGGSGGSLSPSANGSRRHRRRRRSSQSLSPEATAPKASARRARPAATQDG